MLARPGPACRWVFTPPDFLRPSLNFSALRVPTRGFDPPAMNQSRSHRPTFTCMRGSSSLVLSYLATRLTLQHPDKARVGMAAFVFMIYLIDQALRFLWIDGKQNCINLGLHAVVALLGLR